MNCRMTRGIYLRANGDINCYCSTGEHINLGKVPVNRTDFNFIDDIYNNEKHAHIRKSFKENILPFPDACIKCNYLDPEGSYDETLARTEIEWAHIEAAYYCNLKCPFCVHGEPKNENTKKRLSPYTLPVSMYNKIVNDIKTAGLNIKWMYFSGRGEPGLHPDIWDMVLTGKSVFDTNFLVNTNGNITYNDKIVLSGLDKIKIAFDSVRQEIYAQYRINGNVKKIFDLTEKIRKFKHKSGLKSPEIIWQKVMFDFNDSDEELIEYQERAIDLGVDTIKIVYTWTKNYSTKRPEDFPKIFPKIEPLDVFGRSITSEKDLMKRRHEYLTSNNIAESIKFANQLYKWFEIGMKTRTAYDNYARMPLDDPRIYKERRSHKSYPIYKNALIECLNKIANYYKDFKNVNEYKNFSKYVVNLNCNLK